jgi:N utilization substance protein B
MNHPNTHGREIALQYLYHYDLLGGGGATPFADFVSAQQPAPGSEAVAFGEALVKNVIEHRAELDAEIVSVAANWNLERMAAVDRNVLRLGLAELISHPDTSHKIILNEAVELAKRYSSEDAGSFVNGLLDKLRAKHRPETAAS